MHRTASINEYSTRYSEAINLCQKTSPNRWRLQSTTNKQGSGDYYQEGYWLSEEEEDFHTAANKLYQRRLDVGIAREQARKDLPLSTYTEAFWKIDLHNLLHFLRLRCDYHAQLEIRSYANVIAGIVKECCPITFEAWQDYIFEAITFSRPEMQLLNYILDHECYHECADYDELNNKMGLDLSKRELDEFSNKLGMQRTYSFGVDPASACPYEYFQEEHHEKNHQVAEPTSGD